MSDDPHASEPDIEETLKAAFARHGVESDVEAQMALPFAGPLIWIVKVIVEGTAFEAVKRLGKAGFDDVRTVVRRRSDDHGVVDMTIIDSEGTSLSVLAPELSDEAVAALAKVDWSAVRGGEIVWNEELKAWERHEPLRMRGDDPEEQDR